ncbi:MAG: HD domain-containing phosphohydrolase [Humidesulfovibrio sp.]|nr:HD domain-containing phosphohydrolase [Humidesulfovibrio sp.]
MKYFDLHELLRSFFKRSLLFTISFALLLAVALPYLRYTYNVTDYKRDSLEIVSKFLARELDFDLKELRVSKRENLIQRINVFMEYSNLVEFRIWDAEAAVVYSYIDPGVVGQRFPDNDDLLETFHTGKPKISVEEAVKSEHKSLRGKGTLLEMYVPVFFQGRLVGAVELYRLAPHLSLLNPTNLWYSLAALVFPLLLHVFFYGQFKFAALELVRSGVQLQQAYNALAKASFDSIRSLAKALEMRDRETEGHSERVVALSVFIGQRMALEPQQMAKLVIGAYLHDVGKIGVPDAVLLKPGKLTPEERSVIETHVTKGYEIVDEVDFLRLGADVVLSHHEHWDGNGYAQNLSGEDIPIGARIFALVDVFDALMSRRPYKEPFSFESSRTIIRESSGTHFDPRVVEAFLGITEAEVNAIRSEVRHQGVHALVRQATEVLFTGEFFQVAQQ